MRSSTTFVFALTALSLLACQSPQGQRDDTSFAPVFGANKEVLAITPIAELRRLQLVSTNLVSGLVQAPEMNVASTTVQVSDPRTAFGNTIIKALQDAGYGIQRVSADQGLNYVTYGKRLSETESGRVLDYSMKVGGIEVRREFEVINGRIFPSSVLFVEGTKGAEGIIVDDTTFAEQGGNGNSFITGVDGNPSTVGTVTVTADDETAADNRKSHPQVLKTARNNVYIGGGSSRLVSLKGRTKISRTILIFDNAKTDAMGRGNKKAVGQLAGAFVEGDVFSISACIDADGNNEQSDIRAIRIEEEFVSYGVVPDAVQIEPCIRASFRHRTDDSPVAVSVVQYR